MPEFMLLIHEADDVSPAHTKALVESYRAYEKELGTAYLDGERLRPSREGRRVWSDRVETGPFETLSGYYFIQADSLDAAVALAKKCPGDTVDVRPVMKGRIIPNKTSRQGRVFAFGVLGSAQTERAWIGVMDQIDERTSATTPSAILGGVRLREPGSGRRVTSTTTFDGPFLESKEVIGGIFFMRHATSEEAVEYAQRSELAKFGAAEVRELWRS